MKPQINNKNSSNLKSSDLELFIDVHSKKLDVDAKSQNLNSKTDSAAKNKLLAGICFITDLNGIFRYIHPNLLNLLDGLENKIFEKSIFERDQTEGLPTIMGYLVEMIQENRTSVFMENIFKNKNNPFSKLQWNIAYYGGLLNFNLSEMPVPSKQENLSLKTKTSKRALLSAEIEKVFCKIEQTKNLNDGQNYSDNILVH